MKPKIILPTKQTREGSNMSHLKWMVYGPPGVGKSSFFEEMKSEGRAPLYLHTDPGLRFIKAYKQPISSWAQFKGYVDAIVEDPPKIYSIIVLDIIDSLFRMCRKELCDRRDVEHISDEKWGKGYDMLRDEFEPTILKLATLDVHGIGLAFISHQKSVEMKGRLTRTSKIIPTLPSGAHTVLAPLCDIIGYAGFALDSADDPDEMGRRIYFEPSETVEAKDRTGLLPKACDLDFGLIKKYLDEGIKKDGPAPIPSKPKAGQRRKKKRR